MKPLDEFITRWGLVMPIPYVDAINTSTPLEGMPDRWGSALPTALTRNDTTIGSNPHVEETGELTVALFGRAGKGRNVLDQAAIDLVKHFHGWRTPDCTLQFPAVLGPFDVDPSAEGRWWRVPFIVQYVVWSRRFDPVVP